MLNEKHCYMLAYSFVYLAFGIYVSSFGPIIPFYSKVTGHDQTYYSALFFARGIGAICGGFAGKYFLANYSYHQNFVGVLSSSALFSILSSLSFELINLFIWFFLLAASLTIVNVLCPLCMFRIWGKDGPDRWIQTMGIIFGLGGLIGPSVVIYFQETAMRYIGIAIFCCAPAIFLMKSPEAQVNDDKAENKDVLPLRGEIIIATLFMLYVGLESGVSNWIPTYAIKTQVATVQSAGLFSSYFWFTNLGARTFCILLKGTVSERLQILLVGVVVSNFILLIFQLLGWHSLICYCGAITNGLFLSSMYALLLSISSEFGLQNTPNNTSHFIIMSALGDAVVAMGIGYAMGLFGPASFIFCLVALSVTCYYLYRVLLICLKNQQALREASLEKQLIESPSVQKQQIESPAKLFTRQQ